MRKFKFIGTDEDINLYTSNVAEYLVIGKIYSENELLTIYGSHFNPDSTLVKTDWEEVFEEKGCPEQYYQGSTNTLSISGEYNGVVFSLSGDFEQCVKVFNLIGYLEGKNK